MTNQEIQAELWRLRELELVNHGLTRAQRTRATRLIGEAFKRNNGRVNGNGKG